MLVLYKGTETEIVIVAVIETETVDIHMIEIVPVIEIAVNNSFTLGLVWWNTNI